MMLLLLIVCAALVPTLNATTAPRPYEWNATAVANEHACNCTQRVRALNATLTADERELLARYEHAGNDLDAVRARVRELAKINVQRQYERIMAEVERELGVLGKTSVMLGGRTASSVLRRLRAASFVVEEVRISDDDDDVLYSTLTLPTLADDPAVRRYGMPPV